MRPPQLLLLHYAQGASAVEAYWKSVNDAGGINGRPIRIEKFDTGSDPRQAATAAWAASCTGTVTDRVTSTPSARQSSSARPAGTTKLALGNEDQTKSA